MQKKRDLAKAAAKSIGKLERFCNIRNEHNIDLVHDYHSCMVKSSILQSRGFFSRSLTHSLIASVENHFWNKNHICINMNETECKK